MDRVRTLSSLLAALFVTALLALGCDSGTQEPAAPAPEDSSSAAGMAAGSSGAPPDSGGTPNEASEVDPSRFREDLPEGITAAVPGNFPEEIPIYPGSQASQGKGADRDGVPMSAVQLLTNDRPGEVTDFYRDRFEGDGWEIDTREMNGNSAISASKGDCRASVLIAPSADGGSDIFIVTEC